MADVSRIAYQTLLSQLGPQGWWPGESPFEVMVGAVLVQSTAWRNVERAIDRLRNADVLDPHRLAAVAHGELEELVRPAGYYRVKARRLRSLVEYLLSRYDGSVDAMRQVDAATLRDELLAVHGVGPETADSILLYALDKPVMVVDAYAQRIWARHGWISSQADYRVLQTEVARGLPRDAQTYNEFHALLVNVGHHWCKRSPQCDRCPLRELLPPGGAVDSC